MILTNTPKDVNPSIPFSSFGAVNFDDCEAILDQAGLKTYPYNVVLYRLFGMIDWDETVRIGVHDFMTGWTCVLSEGCLASKLGMCNNTVRKALQGLIKAGILKREKHGKCFRYSIQLFNPAIDDLKKNPPQTVKIEYIKAKGAPNDEISDDDDSNDEVSDTDLIANIKHTTKGNQKATKPSHKKETTRSVATDTAGHFPRHSQRAEQQPEPDAEKPKPITEPDTDNDSTITSPDYDSQDYKDKDIETPPPLTPPPETNAPKKVGGETKPLKNSQKQKNGRHHVSPSAQNQPTESVSQPSVSTPPDNPKPSDEPETANPDKCSAATAFDDRLDGLLRQKAQELADKFAGDDVEFVPKRLQRIRVHQFKKRLLWLSQSESNDAEPLMESARRVGCHTGRGFLDDGEHLEKCFSVLSLWIDVVKNRPVPAHSIGFMDTEPGLQALVQAKKQVILGLREYQQVEMDPTLIAMYEAQYGSNWKEKRKQLLNGGGAVFET